MSCNKPLVSISCITYNHEKYIRDAIESFLIQKTNFPIEILINDDASTDRTADIIREYEKKYPELIKPIYQIENQLSKGVKPMTNFIFPRACGKYIAICEGDDYWTDPNKLLKQVNFLELHPDYGLVHTDCDELYNGTGKIINSVNKKNNKNYQSCKNPFYGILTGKYVVKTLTVLVRKELIEKAISTKIFKKNYSRSDLPMWLEIANLSKFHYIPESTAVYRLRKGSITRQTSQYKQIESEEDSKKIRMEFAKRYNVPSEIFEQVEKMYNNVLLIKAYHTNNKELAEKSYKKLKYYKNFENMLLYYGAKRKIIKHFIEILRRVRKGYYNSLHYINKKKI
jgi:glycosyltransferase involved in cell wall biosynthesis